MSTSEFLVGKLYLIDLLQFAILMVFFSHFQPSHEAVEIPMERIGNGSQAGPSSGGQSLSEFFKEASINFHTLVETN